MKMVSEVIKELEVLKSQHGDLPVVTDNHYVYWSDTDSLIITYQKGVAFEQGNSFGKGFKSRVDCIFMFCN